MRLYFDNAASAPMFPEVIEVMARTMAEFPGNPSSIHSHGRKAKAAMEEARKVIAYHLGCSVGEIYFTSGGSEANNTAIKGSILDLDVERVITSKIEHPCVLRSIEHAATYRPLVVDYLQVNQQGFISLEELDDKLRNRTGKTLVTIMHANNEIGTINNIAAIGSVCKQYDSYFHTDTVQTIGHYQMNLSKLDIDMASASAHKFHGPKGIGILYVSQRCSSIKPLIDGGSQERNMRAGTENIPAIIGMAKALEIYVDRMDEFRSTTSMVRDYAKDQIHQYFPDVKINGPADADALYTILSVTFPESKRAELLVFNLDIEGISASGGSACSSGVQKISHVLANIAPTEKGTTVRFSFSPQNTPAEVDLLVEKLQKILKT